MTVYEALRGLRWGGGRSKDRASGLARCLQNGTGRVVQGAPKEAGEPEDPTLKPGFFFFSKKKDPARGPPPYDQRFLGLR